MAPTPVLPATRPHPPSPWKNDPSRSLHPTGGPWPLPAFHQLSCLFKPDRCWRKAPAFLFLPPVARFPGKSSKPALGAWSPPPAQARSGPRAPLESGFKACSRSFQAGPSKRPPSPAFPFWALRQPKAGPRDKARSGALSISTPPPQPRHRPSGGELPSGSPSPVPCQAKVRKPSFVHRFLLPSAEFRTPWNRPGEPGPFPAGFEQASAVETLGLPLLSQGKGGPRSLRLSFPAQPWRANAAAETAGHEADSLSPGPWLADSASTRRPQRAQPALFKNALAVWAGWWRKSVPLPRPTPKPSPFGWKSL